MESAAEVACCFFEVVIIGGGISGLSAATRLLEHGISNFTILEASERLGGRMYSVDYGDSVLDLGAQYIHGGMAANSLYNYAQSKGLLENALVQDGYEDLKNFFTQGGEVLDQYSVEKAFELLELVQYSLVAFSKVNGTKLTPEQNSEKAAFDAGVASAIAGFAKTPEAENYDIEAVEFALKNMGYIIEVLSGEKQELLGLAAKGAFIDLPGGDVNIPGGTRSIILSLANDIGMEFVDFGNKVKKVEWNENGVNILADIGGGMERECQANHVISTIPLGVLKSNTVQFEPSLGTAKEEAINNLNAGRVSKVHLHFENPFWRQGEGFFFFARYPQDLDLSEYFSNETDAGIYDVYEEDLSSYLNYDDKETDWTQSVYVMNEIVGVRNVLIMWVAGDAAEIVDNLSEEEILLGAKQLLRSFTGDPMIPGPFKITRNTWLKDPLAMGTWSSPSVTTKVSDYADLLTGLPSDENPRVLLAGEHAHKKFAGVMHGARLSGIEQADKIINFINNNE
eukprot:TRINITY_DN9951_c0_g1_i14.p1 TRINITY_DN9951_c0_g1~~TRINITY_DN9951_c0_g1_i14.p1  ORF type:complete len:521 (-),score=104.07 TRINITY_DN9951_c0_g1_i14:166-1695(-)